MEQLINTIVSDPITCALAGIAIALLLGIIVVAVIRKPCENYERQQRKAARADYYESRWSK